MKKILFQKDILLAALSGTLFAFSYPPFKAWALFFCFAPLWITWYKAPNIKRVLLTGFVAQFVMTLIGFNWVAHTAIEYGHIPFFLSLLILIGFCCFASLNVMFAGALSFYFLRRFKLQDWNFFILAAVLSAAFEWFYPRIFEWNTGYALLFSQFRTSQLAEYLGFNLLSLLVNLANSCFALAFIRYPHKNWSRSLIVFVVGIFATENLGQWVSHSLGIEDKSITALLVQPNIGNYDKLYAEKGNAYQAPVVEKDFTLTKAGLLEAGNLKPDVIVWPETAFPANLDPYFKDQFYPKMVYDFAKQNKIKLIVGSFSADSPLTPQPKDYNAVFAFDEHGDVLPVYRKHLLLAFGEYFPGSQYFPILKTLVPEISDFGRGVGPLIFKFPEVSFEPLICYEGLDTKYVGLSYSLNPQILINVTNDSWYGTEFEPYQHMIMTIARTIEYRRPMIRVANTGFTVVADSRGQILVKSPQDVEWAKSVSVPYFSHPKITVFSQIVPYLSIIFLILIVLTLFLGRFTRAR